MEEQDGLLSDHPLEVDWIDPPKRHGSRYGSNKVINLDDNTLGVVFSSGVVSCIDTEDYALIKPYRWRELKGKLTSYSITTVQKISGGRKALLMHKLILHKDVQIDHKDQNGLNNKKINLRSATGSENMRNVSIRINNTSGFIGVSWSRTANKWKAEATIDGKCFYLGCFKDPIEAALARDVFAIKNYGEYAVLNFPEKING